MDFYDFLLDKIDEGYDVKYYYTLSDDDSIYELSDCRYYSIDDDDKIIRVWW